MTEAFYDDRDDKAFYDAVASTEPPMTPEEEETLPRDHVA